MPKSPLDAHVVRWPTRFAPSAIKDVLLAEKDGKEGVAEVEKEDSFVDVIRMSAVRDEQSVKINSTDTLVDVSSRSRLEEFQIERQAFMRLVSPSPQMNKDRSGNNRRPDIPRSDTARVGVVDGAHHEGEISPC